MDVTLIICAHNEERVLGETIDIAKKFSNGGFREIVVVDNASTDATAQVAREHGARIVYESRKGLPAARQCGYENSSSEYLAYIDADTLITSDWLKKAQKYFASYPDAVSLSGPRRYFGATRFRLRFLNAMWVLAPIAYWVVGYMLLGGNFVVKRSALEKIGGFDTSVAFYGEDTILARQLSKLGKTLFRMDFYVYASARRFEKEGIIRVNVRYFLNYLWPVIFRRPFTRRHEDVR